MDQQCESVFEVLDFIPDPNKTLKDEKGDTWFDCKSLEPHILESIHRICKGDGEEGYLINLHDAAVFSAYFGVPKDKEKRLEWEKLSFSEKTANILNVFSHGSYISFTKIL